MPTATRGQELPRLLSTALRQDQGRLLNRQKTAALGSASALPAPDKKNPTEFQECIQRCALQALSQASSAASGPALTAW
ncbi:hypothetical protein WJX84_000720 [Apatococcus fuscideae]|uniref:Uncharacterized protein n=1 Tax=Apatococcus fuscideae TaxID=2026836 RepID=A0AAW1T0W6_9CHLO